MKIRVAHSLTRLAGGPAYRTDIVLRYLDPERFDTRLYYGSTSEWDPDSHDEIVRTAPYPCVYIPSMQRELRPLRDAVALAALAREFREFSPHIVHTHESKDALLARVAAHACGVPIVLRHYHGFIYGKGYFGKRSNWLAPLFLGVERALNHGTDVVVNISEGLNHQAVEDYHLAPQSKTFVLNNAFDLDEFMDPPRDPGLRESWGIPLHSRLFVMVANFQRPKNHAGGLRAFAQFVKRHPAPQAHLALAGQGPLEEEIRRLVHELGLADRVHFLGHRKDIARVLSGCDVFLMSSTSEGTPGALIEALAARVPAASTSVGGIADITAGEERAALAPPWEDEQLCDAMERATFSPPDMNAVSAAIAREYGARAVASRLTALYEELWLRKAVRD
jgi:glycosyltransferase involved in cell wall biosynthesis